MHNLGIIIHSSKESIIIKFTILSKKFKSLIKSYTSIPNYCIKLKDFVLFTCKIFNVISKQVARYVFYIND